MDKMSKYADAVALGLIVASVVLVFAGHDLWAWASTSLNYAVEKDKQPGGWIYEYQTLIGGGLALYGAYIAVVRPMKVEREKRNNRLSNLLVIWRDAFETIHDQPGAYRGDGTEADFEHDRNLLLGHLGLIIEELDRFEESYKENHIFFVEHAPNKFEAINKSIRYVSNWNLNFKSIRDFAKDCPSNRVHESIGRMIEMNRHVHGCTKQIEEALS